MGWEECVEKVKQRSVKHCRYKMILVYCVEAWHRSTGGESPEVILLRVIVQIIHTYQGLSLADGRSGCKVTSKPQFPCNEQEVCHGKVHSTLLEG